MQRCPNCNDFMPQGAVQCESCKAYVDGKERVDDRCECGNLVAKITRDTIEIKCRRCKRIRIIDAKSLAERYDYLIQHNE